MLKDTHPEGHDFCGNAGIKTKIPFLNLWQPDAPSEDPLNLLSQSTLDSFTNSCNNWLSRNYFWVLCISQEIKGRVDLTDLWLIFDNQFFILLFFLLHSWFMFILLTFWIIFFLKKVFLNFRHFFSQSYFIS